MAHEAHSNPTIFGLGASLQKSRTHVKKSQQETQVLFELIAHRYERASLIITSNQAFTDWDQIFPDQMMTMAAVDRLAHHASIIEIVSDS